MATEDYLMRRKQAGEAVSGLLSSQIADSPQQSKRAMESVSGGRGAFLGAVGLPQELVAQQLPRLNRLAGGKIARNAYDSSGGLIQKQFDHFFNLATEAGLDVQEATQFAREKAAQTKQEEFQASQAELDRQSQQRMLDLKEKYANLGQAVEDRYANMDNGSALARILIGSGVGIASAYGYNKADQNRAAQQQSALTKQRTFAGAQNDPYTQQFYPSTTKQYGRTAGVSY